MSVSIGECVCTGGHEGAGIDRMGYRNIYIQVWVRV